MASAKSARSTCAIAGWATCAQRGRQLLDAALGEAGQGVGRAAERREGGAARLVRKRDGHLGTAGQRLDQPPLGRGQVLEAVGEDRLGLPGLEVALEPLDGVRAQQVAVPERKPVELGPVGGVEAAEVAVELVGRDERGAELAHRVAERVDEALRARRRREAVERRLRRRAPEQQCLLHLGGDRPCGRAAREAAEQVVERADRAAHETAETRDEIPLGTLDVRPVRHDQVRIAIDCGRIALEEQRDLAGVRRPDDQREGHLRIVRTPSDGTRPPGTACPQRAGIASDAVLARPGST